MIDKFGKKPITPNRELLDLLQEWVAPDVTQSKKSEFVGKTNFMGTPLEELYSKVLLQETVEEEEVKPLTAEDIEHIRQDAYTEGFELGKVEGYQAGEEQGLQEGHDVGVKNGHEQGYLAGLEQGQFEMNEKIARLNDLSHQLYHPIDKVDKVAEQQLLNLVVILAESVLRQEIKSNKDVLLTVLHEATSSLPFNTDFAEIHIHPEDLKLLTETYSDEAIIEKKWIIKEEPGYQIGDIIVMTPDSLIDRSVKQRIKQSIGHFIDKAELEKELNDYSQQTTRHIPKEDTVSANVETNLAVSQDEAESNSDTAITNQQNATDEVLDYIEAATQDPNHVSELNPENKEG